MIGKEKKKLDVDFRPYVILGACNPKLAHRAAAPSAQIGELIAAFGGMPPAGAE